jgi:hypothetical protein
MQDRRLQRAESKEHIMKTRCWILDTRCRIQDLHISDCGMWIPDWKKIEKQRCKRLLMKRISI